MLACSFTESHPRAEVIWLKNGQPIDLDLMGFAKDFKIEIAPENTCLEIREANLDDTGSYTVLLRNPLGQVRSSTQLTVKEYKNL